MRESLYYVALVIASAFLTALIAPHIGRSEPEVPSDGREPAVADNSITDASEPAGTGDLGDEAWVVVDEVPGPGEPGAGGAVDNEPTGVAPWTDADVRAALAGRSVMVRRIVWCEIGRSGTYDPYAVGSLGELGPAQLLPGRGNGLSIFYSWGFDDPFSPWQAVAFIERVIERGMLASQYPRTSRGCVGSP